MTRGPALTGFLAEVDIRRTPDKGLGVFAKAPITACAMVWRHAPGAYAVYDESGFREALSNLSRERAVYELTHVFGVTPLPGLLIRILDAGVLINHDAPGNLATNLSAPLAARRLDPQSPGYRDDAAKALLEDRFALIATRDIAAGEELTIDYSEDVADPEFYLDLCDAYGVEEDYLDDG